MCELLAQQGVDAKHELLEHDKPGTVRIIGPSFFEQLGGCAETVQNDPFGAKGLKKEHITLWEVGGQRATVVSLVNQFKRESWSNIIRYSVAHSAYRLKAASSGTTR